MSGRVPSGCPSPARLEKTDSSSSQESEFSLQLDFDSGILNEPLNGLGIIRPSSWDESDDDSLPDHEPSRLYSNDGKIKGSVANEINELKKQFFETLEKMKEGYRPTLENSANKVEDRRQCPARIKRRTKSSGSLSPVLETKNQNLAEKLYEPIAIFDEVSSKISELDPKFYLDNFFNELRSKRITITDSAFVENKTVEKSNESGECTQMNNDLTNQNSNENDGYFCKTSRKLSQIIEVEENRKDLEKSSEEALENSELYSESLKIPEENLSPLPTSRSRSEKISENLKLLNPENVEDLEKPLRPFQGSLSDRSKLFHKPNDNYSFQLPKSAKDLTEWLNNKHSKDGFKVACFNSQLETDKIFSEKSNSRDDEKENNFDSHGFLKTNLMKNSISENPTPRSTDWSELSCTTRIRSGKSRNSFSESPKLKLSLERDSARSLKVEDVNTPDFEWKSEIKIESRPRTVSFEDCSPSKSRRSPDRSETSFDPKSERNLQILLDSSSLESVNSSSCSSKELGINSSKNRDPKSTGKSQRKKEKIRKSSACSDLKEPMDNYSLNSNKNLRKSLGNSRAESPSEENESIEISNDNQSKRSSRTPHFRSSGSSRSDKTKSPKTAKERFIDHSYDPETSTYDKIPELALPLDISESQKSSSRSQKTPELKNVPNNSVRSDIKTSKRSSRRSSDRSSSSKSKSTDSTKRTPKITPRTNDSISSISKEDLENHAEIENTDFSWAQLKKTNEILSSRASSGSRSSWRERKKSSLESSPQKVLFNPELQDSKITGKISPENITPLEERRSKSGKSSKRSLDSFASDSTRNNSPTKSIKAKFSPHFLSSEEAKISDHPEIEKLYSEITNIINSNKISTFPEEEEEGEVKENQLSQRIKSESESDRYSEKRLSIINEVSFEDLEISNESNAENERNSRQQSGGSSGRENRELSSQRFYHSTKSTPKMSKSQKQAPKDESINQQSELVGEKWNELIEAFRESPNSSFILENTFSAFPYRKDIVREDVLTGREITKNHSSALSGRISGSKYDISDNNFSFENKTEEQEEEEEFKKSNAEYKEHLLQKPLKKHIRPFQNFQNLYYTDVYERKPFGIGECGDVTIYNVDKSDTSEKPKDHGDGSPLQNPSEILSILGKRANEVKIQRHLWTDLKGDFRNAKEKLNKLLVELEDQNNSTHTAPIDVKKSKSDNCIVRKNEKNNDFKISSNCNFKNQNKLELEDCKAKKPTENHLSIDSLENEKGDVANEEFDCEITPRLSKSMIDLDSQLQKENFEEVELNIYNSSGSQLFERTSETTKDEKEITNLSIFLAHNQKEDKMAMRPNNWLNFKALEVENFHKKGKKSKKKRKDLNSPKNKHQGYLSTRKSRSSVPQLKLRNPNCFQSFYKRIIGVFCLTSHSSAATSK